MARQFPVKLALLATFVVLCGQVIVHAQSSSWYQANNHGNRYEGLVEVPNALRDYELLGVFAVEDIAHTSPSSQLNVRFFVPPNTTLSTFVVKEVQSDTQYMMKPIIEKLAAQPGEWNAFSNWPVHDVIAPNHVQLSNLGVIIKLNGAVPEMYAPAVFYSATAPAQIQAYTIDFVSHRELKTLKCTVLDDKASMLDAQKQPYPCKVLGAAHGLESSRPVTIQVNAATLPPGMITVHLSGEYANDESGAKLHADIHFMNQKLKS